MEHEGERECGDREQECVGEGKKEEEGELKKGELCEFLSRVIRGRELGMSGKATEDAAFLSRFRVRRLCR